jgi:hypothetical protein
MMPAGKTLMTAIGAALVAIWTVLAVFITGVIVLPLTLSMLGVLP